MDISIHHLTEAELDAADEVIMVAYHVPSRREALHRSRALQPQGCYVAKDAGALVGFGAAIDYGPFASIGLMAVHPSRQHQGVGRMVLERLLAWLERRGCPTALLDASAAGAPLYEQAGFLDADQAVVLQRPSPVALPCSLPEGVSVLNEHGLPQVIAFDAPHLGAERGAVLASYRVTRPERLLVKRSAEGKITGYLLAQAHTLGPWVTLTKADAEALLVHALALPFVGDPTVCVSACHHEALELLADAGFKEQRVLRHMWKGTALQRDRATTLYGQASLGLG